MAYTLEDAKKAARQLGISNKTLIVYGLEQFRWGINVETEHGPTSPATDVTGGDLIKTAKIAKAHLDESPSYYLYLAEAEGKAEAQKKCDKRAAYVSHGTKF